MWAALSISWALEASPSINSHLLHLKLASRRLDVARGASSRVCAPQEVCTTTSHSKWLRAWEVISPLGEEHRDSWASTLESFLNEDVSPLGVNFGKQIECLMLLLFISRSCWPWTRFVPIYFCGVFLCARPLAGYSRNYWWTFDSNTFPRFSLKLVIRSNSYSRRKFLHSVGSSDG